MVVTAEVSGDLIESGGQNGWIEFLGCPAHQIGILPDSTNQFPLIVPGQQGGRTAEFFDFIGGPGDETGDPRHHVLEVGAGVSGERK